MARLNGWKEGSAALWRTRSAQARRAARRRALERGAADPMFEPFSKRLAPDFQAAVDRFMAEKEAPRVVIG
jgi:hypothetical protein